MIGCSWCAHADPRSPAVRGVPFRRGLPDDVYLRRWHEGPTTLSLRVHPLWHYERNVVVRPLPGDAASCDGIVSEACPTRQHLLDPRHFYGGTWVMVPNMVRIFVDLLGFLDLGRTEVYFAVERVWRRNMGEP